MADIKDKTLENLKHATRALFLADRSYPYISNEAADDVFDQFVEAMAAEIERRLMERGSLRG